MTQSVINEYTFSRLVSKSEAIISRELTEMEKALLEYAIDQIRLGLVEVA